MPNQNTVQGTQQPPTGDREFETTIRKILKITFKRLREEPPPEETREDTNNEAYLLQCKKYGRVVSDTDSTKSDEETDYTLPSKAPWEGEYIPPIRPTTGGKTLPEGMGPLPSHPDEAQTSKKVLHHKSKYYRKPKRRPRVPPALAQIPRVPVTKQRKCRAFAEIKHYQKFAKLLIRKAPFA